MYFVALLLTLQPVLATLHTAQEDEHLCEMLVALLAQHPEQESAPVFVRAALLSHQAARIIIRITLAEQTQTGQAPASLQRLLSLSSFHLEQQDYRIMSVELTDPVWTGIATWDDFVQPRRSSLVRFALATPLVTSASEDEHFSGIGPFPEPTLLFSGLRQRWSMLGGPVLPQDVERLIKTSGCLVSNYHLHSVVVEGKYCHSRGYLGWFEYEYRKHSYPEVASLNALARLAFFTGLGACTEQGMGETAVMLLY
jgi:hypothetical protein